MQIKNINMNNLFDIQNKINILYQNLYKIILKKQYIHLFSMRHYKFLIGIIINLYNKKNITYIFI